MSGRWVKVVPEPARHVTGEEVLATYTLQLIGPGVGVRSFNRPSVPYDLRVWLFETEENLTDLLPPGYSVRIKEWDE